MGIEQTLDARTRNNLQCGISMSKMRKNVTHAAKGENEKVTGEEKKKEAKIDGANNPNRTLFSPKSLREHNVPGYGEEPIANLGEVEEADR